jgi:predicted phosphodiesterase
MRYAIISDIHGNVEALQAVFADIRKKNVDSIICLGDIVGYYPDPERCIELVKKEVEYCVAGNHDYAAIGRIDTQNFTYYAYAAMEWTKQNISEKAIEYLQSLPLTVNLENMYFTHSSPSNPQDWVYVFPDSEETVFEAFNSLVYGVNFIGHTHWPSIMIQEKDRGQDLGQDHRQLEGKIGEHRAQAQACGHEIVHPVEEVREQIDACARAQAGQEQEKVLAGQVAAQRAREPAAHALALLSRK